MSRRNAAAVGSPFVTVAQWVPVERRTPFIAIHRLRGKGFAYRLESGHGDRLGHLGRHSVTPKYIDQS
jgi:hypothetical protein